MNNIIYEELIVLSEIYDNLSFKENPIDKKVYGTFQADIKLGEIENVIVKMEDRSLELSYFPNLILNFSISDKETLYISYTIECIWLSSKFKDLIIIELKSMESDYDGVLWRWFQFLEMESLKFIFGLTSQGTLEINANYMNNEDLITNDELYNLLYQYDFEKKKSTFNSSIIECSSCLEQKRGNDCIRLRNCKDIFCNNCASGYFNNQIKNGDLDLRCLVCPGEVYYDEIKGVLNQEQFDRWDQLVLKRYLKGSGIVKPCPRCQTMSPVEDNCGLCPKCNFAFCLKCNDTYHTGSDCDQDCHCPICKSLCKVTMSSGLCQICRYEFCVKCFGIGHPGISCHQRRRDEEALRLFNLKLEKLVLIKSAKFCSQCKEEYKIIGRCSHSGFYCNEDCYCLFCQGTCKVTTSFETCQMCRHGLCSKCFRFKHPERSCEQNSKIIEALRIIALKDCEVLLKKRIKMCPNCGEGYEKVGGCNHMVCPSCRVSFCYRCGGILTQSNPIFGIFGPTTPHYHTKLQCKKA